MIGLSRTFYCKCNEIKDILSNVRHEKNKGLLHKEVSVKYWRKGQDTASKRERRFNKAHPYRRSSSISPISNFSISTNFVQLQIGFSFFQFGVDAPVAAHLTHVDIVGRALLLELLLVLDFISKNYSNDYPCAGNCEFRKI